jgi:hypothetical protein
MPPVKKFKLEPYILDEAEGGRRVVGRDVCRRAVVCGTAAKHPDERRRTRSD